MYIGLDSGDRSLILLSSVKSRDRKVKLCGKEIKRDFLFVTDLCI